MRDSSHCEFVKYVGHEVYRWATSLECDVTIATHNLQQLTAALQSPSSDNTQQLVLAIADVWDLVWKRVRT